MPFPMPEQPEPSKPVWEIVATVASRLPDWIHEEVFMEKPAAASGASNIEPSSSRPGVDRPSAPGLPSEQHSDDQAQERSA